MAIYIPRKDAGLLLDMAWLPGGLTKVIYKINIISLK
jgi:hypothetical protein